MELFFLRMHKGIPTTTNHVESFHHYVNDSISNIRNRYRKLGILTQCVDKQVSRIDDNLLRKIRDYIKNTKSFALSKIKENPQRIEEFSQDHCCSSIYHDSEYYSILYNTEMPCARKILNKNGRAKICRCFCRFVVAFTDLSLFL